MSEKTQTPKHEQEPVPSTNSAPALPGKDELTKEELDKATGGLLPAVAPQH
jgi:hypothetical protein